MAFDAITPPHVHAIVDMGYLLPSAVRIVEKSMASKTMLSRRVDRQRLDLIRVISGVAVTVFAFNRFMGRTVQGADVFLVTLNAVLPPLVLDRKVFPLLNVAEAIKTVGKILSVNTEVVRNEEQARHQN